MREFRISKSVTLRTDMLERYFGEISQYEVMTTDQEEHLAQKVKDGDLMAIEKFILSNLRFVVSVAKKYQHLGFGLDDLIADGNVGLIRAVHRFDVTKGFKFISFAVWWIRQSILSGIAEKRRLVKLPGNVVIGIAKLEQKGLELEQVLERKASPEELAEYTGMGFENVVDYLAGTAMALSLDSENPTLEEGGALIERLEEKQTPGPDQAMISDALTTELKRLLDKLSEREKNIISLFYGLEGNFPMTMEDIGQRLKLSKERIRQLKTRAMRTLRNNCPESLSAYL
eukprot:gene2768-3188_t